jgi:hypothetical protein
VVRTCGLIPKGRAVISSMPLQSTLSKGDTHVEAASGGAIKILSPGGRPSSLKPSKRIAAVTPIREEPNKSLRPQGTSPMKESGQNGEKDNNEDSTSKANMSLNLDSLVKSDSKEVLSDEEDTEANSIANENAILRAQLFKGGMQESASKGHEDGCISTAITASIKGSRKAKPWVPIAKGDGNEAEVPKRGAVFAKGTQFNDKPGKPLKKMPGVGMLTACCKAFSLANVKGMGTNDLVIRSLDD